MDDTRRLRNAFGAFATGVTVVTTKGPDGTDLGRTANSFSSVSLSPPMVLWSLARSSSSLAAFRDADHFAVHVLTADQADLSARFAGKDPDKFAGLAVDRGVADVPLLRDCTARFECRTVHRYDGGDHIIFVAEVCDHHHAPAPPLIFHGGAYGGLAPIGDAGG
ncbi:flavin reductase family protein [Falsirhodobacter halotolerans]|uniref:flavin reductase family protein n=1 Tax=Falsirhodobacter halotolerans TaxID=1146892 RepID=UPI001FD0B865|nr:flavin reductase family protein [Falsirhodobacter halotolerans]MCJ8140954.1 flavin reductase family protein [Falsirhodobacter halotolerans]